MLESDQACQCLLCPSVSDDLRQVVSELQEMKSRKWRGTVEYRLDGSGRIISSTCKSYREIILTMQTEPE
jgi:hypothetical protein